MNLTDYNSFTDLFLSVLKAIDHLNMNMLLFCWHTACFKVGISKVQDFENFELTPMYLQQTGKKKTFSGKNIGEISIKQR